MTVEQGEQGPNSLDLAPAPKVRRMSRRIGIVVVAAVIVVFMIMGYNMQQQPPAPPPSGQTLPEPKDSKVLLEPEGKGLVTPEPTAAPAPVVKSDGGPLVSQPARRVDPAVLQQREQVLRYRSQLQLQALQSPLSVAARSGGADIRRSAPVEERTGRNDVYERHPVDGGGDYNPAAQKDKEAFLERRAAAQDTWTLPHTRTAGAFCEIKTGTVIPGMMLSGVNSDLPGRLVAQVSQNVYDTATGNMLILPQGSRLFGIYDSRVIMGQSRVLIAWNRVVFPDGSSVDLGSMPGADQAGYAGFNDTTDNHYFRIFGSSLLMSLVTGGMAYSMDALRPDSGSNSTQNPTVQDEMGTALAGQMGQASLQLLQKNINIQPTLEIRPGYRFNLVVVKDIVFDAPYTPLRRRHE